MECPRCKKTVPSSAAACPGCGGDLSLPRSFLELKQGINRAEIETYESLQRFRQLKGQLTAIEKIMSEAPLPAVTEHPTTVVPEVEVPETVPSTTVGPPTVPGGDERDSAQAESDPSRVTVPPALKEGLRQALRSAPASPAQVKGLFEVKLGQKWLLIIGIVIMILGIGYFLKYSFDQNWIGPAGRVAMAYLAGIACLGAGEFARRKDFAPFGLYLIGGGIAVLYFSTFAAFQIYELIGQVPSFGIMVLVTVLAGILSLFYDTKWLAVLGIIGGFLTPVILSTGRDNQVALMTYMVILNAGILSVAFFKRWSLLTYLGATFTWVIFAAWFDRYYRGDRFWRTTVFLNIFFLTYAVAPFAYFLVRTTGERLRGFAVTVPNAFIAFGFSYFMIKSHTALPTVSVVSLAYAGIYTAMAGHLYRRNREHLDVFILLLAKAVLFLVITIPVLFSRHWITVFWAAQAAALLWAALRLKSRWLYGGALILLILTTGKFYFYDYGEVFRLWFDYFRFRNGYGHLLTERLLTTGIVLANLAYFARRFLASDRGVTAFGGRDGSLYVALLTVLTFLSLNIEVGCFFHDYAPRARFASFSVLWTFFAALLMILGFRFNRPWLRRAAIGLFGLTILKVFFSDMENVSTPFRIVSFLVLGLLLIGTSFLYHRYRELILPEDGPPSGEGVP